MDWSPVGPGANGLAVIRVRGVLRSVGRLERESVMMVELRLQ